MPIISEKKVIFCFSGTGNSLKMADDMAELIDAKIMNIAPLLENKSVMMESETIGFVFPIYDFKTPKKVSSRTRKSWRNIISWPIFSNAS